MTATPKPDPMDVLMDTYLAELTEMSDEAVLDGKDPDSVLAAGVQLLDGARAEAGRRRLAAARQKLQAKTETPSGAQLESHISAFDARAALRQAAATNDGRYTLAARQLDEMADEDVIRAYRQLRRLESEGDPGTPGAVE
ncbi:hypothetical protein [Piscinibacter sp. HJYY11]|uniref:hypothetical protein n=1 Tax=Piscinibacter sp. HJYY11 TaxID=2801333 RepID=UPI00191C921A|nr:hypothetical protein [Piscinibacter sp. HJYY11]MBL0726620.1 hypothetical protein [Piscinibacter sp. HJYY11]